MKRRALAIVIGAALQSASTGSISFLVDDLPDVGFVCGIVEPLPFYTIDNRLTIHAADCTADRVFRSGFEP